MVTSTQPITHCYEGMLIYDARAAKKDLDALEATITELFAKHGVEIAASHRWGERRFAYEIKRQKKGFYILYHVNADPSGLAGLRRDLGLQEGLLRFLFLRIPSIPETFEFPSDPEERDDRRGPRGRDDRPRDGDRRSSGGDKPAEGESKPEAAAESKPEAATAEAPAETPAETPADTPAPAEGAGEPEAKADEAPKTEEA